MHGCAQLLKDSPENLQIGILLSTVMDLVMSCSNVLQGHENVQHEVQLKVTQC